MASSRINDVSVLSGKQQVKDAIPPKDKKTGRLDDIAVMIGEKGKPLWKNRSKSGTPEEGKTISQRKIGHILFHARPDKEIEDLVKSAGKTRTEVRKKKAPFTPDQAHELMRETAEARRAIVHIFGSQKMIPDDVLKKTVKGPKGKTVQVLRTLSELESEIDRLPMAKLTTSDRKKVALLKEMINQNLEVLNQAAEGKAKLRRPEYFDPHKILSGRVQDQEMKTVQAKARELVKGELKALTSGTRVMKTSYFQKSLKGGEGKREAFQLVYRFDRLLKTRPDFRIALGAAMDPKIPGSRKMLEKWVHGMRLNPGTKRWLKAELIKCLRKRVPLNRTGKEKDQNLKLVKQLGQGGSGAIVYAAKLNGKDVVVKKVSREKFGGTLELIGEGLMQGAFHDNPHVPKVIGVCYDETTTFSLVMDRVPGPDYDTLLKYNEQLDPKVALNCFAGIAKGLEKMHERGLAHWDIKPKNVMLDENTMEPRLIDFGFSNIPQDEPDFRGTLPYMAPEQAMSGPAEDKTTAVDVFGMGAVLYKLIEGKLPRGDQPSYYSIRNTKPGNFKDPCWKRQGMKAIRGLIERCWDKEFKNRPTTKQIIQALNGKTVTPAKEGEMGLKHDQLKVLDVLKPDSPFRQNVGEAMGNLINPAVITIGKENT